MVEENVWAPLVYRLAKEARQRPKGINICKVNLLRGVSLWLILKLRIHRQSLGRDPPWGGGGRGGEDTWLPKSH